MDQNASVIGRRRRTLVSIVERVSPARDEPLTSHVLMRQVGRAHGKTALPEETPQRLGVGEQRHRAWFADVYRQVDQPAVLVRSGATADRRERAVVIRAPADGLARFEPGR